MRPTILLFDIDGTLITTGGVGRRALEAAFKSLHGRDDACSSFRLDGMTDRAIVRLGLQAIGKTHDEDLVEAVLEHYLLQLETLIATVSGEQYRVHPGMAEAVAAAHQHQMAVGLGTGNIREGARLKLERVGLFKHFRFGGFGDDHEERAKLILRGAERGAAHLNVPLAEARVVVIGDTPKDVLAAQAIGAESIGVGTGSFTAAQLLDAGATKAFDSLAVPGALEALLRG